MSEMIGVYVARPEKERSTDTFPVEWIMRPRSERLLISMWSVPLIKTIKS